MSRFFEDRDDSSSDEDVQPISSQTNLNEYQQSVQRHYQNMRNAYQISINETQIAGRAHRYDTNTSIEDRTRIVDGMRTISMEDIPDEAFEDHTIPDSAWEDSILATQTTIDVSLFRHRTIRIPNNVSVNPNIPVQESSIQGNPVQESPVQDNRTQFQQNRIISSGESMKRLLEIRMRETAKLIKTQMVPSNNNDLLPNSETSEQLKDELIEEKSIQIKSDHVPWWQKKWGPDHLCSICLGRLRPARRNDTKPKVITLKCKHRIHAKCYEKLLQSNTYQVRCPLCRSDI